MIWRVLLFWLVNASPAWANLPRPSPFVSFCSNEFIFSQKPTTETKIYLTQPSGSWSQQYGYDSAWRLTNLASPAGVFGYGYSSANPASALFRTLSLPNSASISNNYDSMARLNYTALLNYWGHPLDGYSYQNDAWGQRTNITRQLGLTANSVAAYYDGIGELAWWTGAETNGTLRQNEQLGYAYDAANNLHYRTNGLLVQTFTDNTLNEISNVTRTGTFTETGATPAPATNITVNGVTAQRYGDFTFATTNITLTNGNNTFTTIAQNSYGVKVTNSLTVNLPSTVSFQSDANGNLTNDGTRVFSYDAENQLTNVAVSGQYQVAFVYDGLNRRRIERDYTWQSGAWLKTNETRFIYDGMQIIQERDTNNNPLVTYTRGVDMSMSLSGAGGIGGLLARTDANGSTYYHADGNGDITALMDGNENIVARYEYDGFGGLLGIWGTNAQVNRMRFSSFFTADGIVLSPTRPYFQELQRWGSKDPIGEMDGFNNAYGFVGNNPLNAIDPYGLSWWNPFSWFHSSQPQSHRLDPNSLQALENAEGVGVTPLTDENGNIVSPNGALGMMAKNAGNYTLQAGMLFTPMGDENVANDLADEGYFKGLWNKCKSALKREPPIASSMSKAATLMDMAAQGKLPEALQQIANLGQTPEGRRTLQAMSDLYERMRAGALNAQIQDDLRLLSEASRYYSGGPK